jgi:hypothetical protein
VNAYDLAAWHDLFVMNGGAAATLAGLLFVAVSLNHEHVIERKGLPELAAVSIMLLVGLVVLSVVVLMPVSSHVTLGVLVVILGATLATAVFVILIPSLKDLERVSWRVQRVALSLLSTLPVITAGASLMAEAGGGLYWLAVEIVAALVTATYNAWVLLIEIRR